MIRLQIAGTGEEFGFAPARLVVAGYTGRDADTVAHHIDELAAIGIPPPSRVPMRYDLDPALLTTDATTPVSGRRTSGEVEPVLLRRGGRWYLGVGSDHTDRDLERDDIGRSKAACPKPIGPVVVALPGDPAGGGLDAEWDTAIVASRVDGDAYQDGRLSALRTPDDLLTRLADAVTGVDDVAVFAGTVPLLAGDFRFGREWTLRLEIGPHTLTHTYRTC